jgi:hypothetical protein
LRKWINFGVKARHGGHQLAEKYKPMYFPRTASREVKLPSGETARCDKISCKSISSGAGPFDEPHPLDRKSSVVKM